MNAFFSAADVSVVSVLKLLVHIEIKPKHSLMPHHPCTHFIERRVYAETLQRFFRSKTQLAQTFILWGMGGIG